MNTWFFVYAGIDHVAKSYTFGFYSEGLAPVFSTNTQTLTNDGNEQLDYRMNLYVGGSKGVALNLIGDLLYYQFKTILKIS